MGMDGISISNTGIIKESTSADYTTRIEQTIQNDPTNDIKQVQILSTNRRVKEKDEEENQKRREQNSAEEEFNDEFIESNQSEAEEDFGIDYSDDSDKDFYVKLNAKDDIIELYDSVTNRLVETISGNELSELVKKLNMASGIFINKKV